jgi:16S rRNA (cytosine967-C5)-methyltransferase
MNARAVALMAVRDVFPPPGSTVPERGAQEALDYRARKAHLDLRDRNFATQLAYGSIKMRRALDWYLAPFIGGRTQPLPVVVHEILRLAVFELVYTEPDEHATVFEFVNLAKKYGHRGLANLANAVLRGFLRDRPADPSRELFETEEEYLGVRYSLPAWIVRQWSATFGDRVEEICAAVNEPAASALTANTLHLSPEDAARVLAARGIATHPSAFVPESLLLERSSATRALEGEAPGDLWQQSESSAMPVEVLQPQPGEAILDVCSGRGNKALQIGARLAGDGSLICIEDDERRTATLQSRLEAAGIAAGIVTGDATTGLLLPSQRFDRALVDAPCSGVGVVGRHPEARWKKRSTDGERLAITQRAILEAVAPHVLEGGALVYAVCSTDPRETTEVVDWFLMKENFERGLIPAAFEPLLTDAGDVLVPPGIDGRDGFYVARLERRT